MHFAVPYVKELYDSSGSYYQAFDINVNGAMHCTVRYRQLHTMNEQLHQEFPNEELPTFPPKKLFTLKGVELEERRRQLEIYLQELSQREELVQSDVFASFLQKAQQETRLEKSLPVTIDIYLMNGSKVPLKINSTDQTGDVQESLFYTIGLDPDLVYYFALFLVEEDDERLVLVRQLQDFECPYISLKHEANPDRFRIVVRKSYWDSSIDALITHNGVAANLLHAQAERDVRMGWLSCTKGIKKQLTSLTKKGSKQEYLALCQTLQKYGYVQFEPCECSYPQPMSKVVVSIGGYEIRFRYLKDDHEASFQVTRIKSWKIASKNPSSSAANKDLPELQLSFEYLVDKENLKWISVRSDQAIVISMCIKSMVNEIVRKQKGLKIKKPSERGKRHEYAYKLRDEAAAKLFQSQSDAPPVHDDSKSVTKRLSKKLKKNRITFGNRMSMGAGNSSDSDDFSLLSNALPMGESGIGEDDL